MSKGRGGLFRAICNQVNDGLDNPIILAAVGSDMGGQWLTVKYLNDDEEWESYTISAERIN